MLKLSSTKKNVLALPVATIEKPSAQQVFQCGDALADGGLREMELLGSAGEALGFRHGEKGLQALGIHSGS